MRELHRVSGTFAPSLPCVAKYKCGRMDWGRGAGWTGERAESSRAEEMRWCEMSVRWCLFCIAGIFVLSALHLGSCRLVVGLGSGPSSRFIRSASGGKEEKK